MPDNSPPRNELFDLVKSMKATIDTLTKRLSELEAKQAEAPPTPVQATPFARRAWEEEIWVEAIIDCLYPDFKDPDNYSRYRNGRRNGAHGDVFRIAHREHLAKHLRELKKEELEKLQDEAPPKVIPQTAARGQRVRENVFAPA